VATRNAVRTSCGPRPTVVKSAAFDLRPVGKICSFAEIGLQTSNRVLEHYQKRLRSSFREELT
jgi:hypothetical protein